MSLAAFRGGPRAALLLALGIALGGCATARYVLPAEGPGVVLVPRGDPQSYNPGARLFFVEYLRESSGTTRRVAVLAEPVTGTLAMILNPKRYDSGNSGVASLGEMVRRYQPLRLRQIRDAGGKPIGYAFLPRGAGLRTLSRRGGRYTFALTGR